MREKILPIYSFKCNICHSSDNIFASMANAPSQVKCRKCDSLMVRDYSTIQFTTMPIAFNDDLNPRDSLDDQRQWARDYDSGWEVEANSNVVPGVNAEDTTENLIEWARTGT